MAVHAHLLNSGSYEVALADGATIWSADADVPLGQGESPSPHQLLDSALAACTAITLRMYAERKAWPLQDVQVQIEHVEQDGVYTMSRSIKLIGDLDDEARKRLMEIANKCPIHKLLSGKIEIHTALADVVS